MNTFLGKNINYKLYLSDDASNWVVEVWNDEESKKFKELVRVGYPPRFGIDVADAQEIDKVLNRIIDVEFKNDP